MTDVPGDAGGRSAAPNGPGPSPRGRLVMAGAWILGHLPEGPLVAAADALGELWYRTAPTKREQARRNLLRVCEHLAATGRGPAPARRAATDPAALERLVRAAFRHGARYYLEVARASSQDLPTALARLELEEPDAVRGALGSGRPVIIAGMHFGAIELPVIVVSDIVGHAVTAPMETVADPGLAHWFRTTRSKVGVRVVPIANARRALLAALRRGESVGLVAERDLTDSGIPVPFFGHPAPLPAGPALLALETGVPIYAGSARRMRDGRYLGRLLLVPAPSAGTRRERLVAYTAAMAGTFETLLADAPEQWWGAFHPIWGDIAVGRPAQDAADEPEPSA